MRIIMVLVFILFSQTNFVWAQQPLICNGPEHQALDFWVGKWNLSWEGGSGTNEITKQYDGCVIHENFKGSNLKGMSVSTYSKQAGTWRQIWMDEQNSFIDLYGKMDGKNYIFHTTPDPQKPNVQLQMVFSDIETDNFTWTWMQTSDDGETWQDLWTINYSRAD